LFLEEVQKDLNPLKKEHYTEVIHNDYQSQHRST
jgi:hypothetical protein